MLPRSARAPCLHGRLSSNVRRLGYSAGAALEASTHAAFKGLICVGLRACRKRARSPLCAAPALWPKRENAGAQEPAPVSSSAPARRPRWRRPAFSRAPIWRRPSEQRAVECQSVGASHGSEHRCALRGGSDARLAECPACAVGPHRRAPSPLAGRLTGRSSRPAPARPTGRQGRSSMLASSASGPCLHGRLSSNVRQHEHIYRDHPPQAFVRGVRAHHSGGWVQRTPA